MTIEKFWTGFRAAITKDEIKQKINSANTEEFLKIAILDDDEGDKFNDIFLSRDYVEGWNTEIDRQWELCQQLSENNQMVRDTGIYPDGLIRWSAMGHDTIGRLLGSIFNLGLTAIVEKEDERGVRIVEPNTNNKYLRV